MSGKSKRLIRLPEVMNISAKSRSAIYEGMAHGDFPKPVKLSSRSVAWVEEEILAWVRDQIAASRSNSGGA